jgi:probable F420-dependent oxidoreductase
VTRPDLGRVGLWTGALELQTADRVRVLVDVIEDLGWPTIWIPEAVNRDAMVNAALILSTTERLHVATGIANIWARDPMATRAAHETLAEAWPDRFTLGLGVSHQPAVEGFRGHTYDKPFSHMKAYLEAMENALYVSPRAEDTSLVLAALGPKMLELAAERADGAHPYFVPVAHTAFARERLGPDAVLAPEQAVVLESDPGEARRIARHHMATYLNLPNYTNNLRRLGWGDDDLADGGSDALVDAIVAWGDEQTVLDRVAAHHDAGADHVAIQALPHQGVPVPTEEWERLAEALGF